MGGCLQPEANAGGSVGPTKDKYDITNLPNIGPEDWNKYDELPMFLKFRQDGPGFIPEQDPVLQRFLACWETWDSTSDRLMYRLWSSILDYDSSSKFRKLDQQDTEVVLKQASDAKLIHICGYALEDDKPIRLCEQGKPATRIWFTVDPYAARFEQGTVTGFRVNDEEMTPKLQWLEAKTKPGFGGHQDSNFFSLLGPETFVTDAIYHHYRGQERESPHIELTDPKFDLPKPPAQGPRLYQHTIDIRPSQIHRPERTEGTPLEGYVIMLLGYIDVDSFVPPNTRLKEMFIDACNYQYQRQIDWTFKKQIEDWIRDSKQRESREKAAAVKAAADALQTRLDTDSTFKAEYEAKKQQESIEQKMRDEYEANHGQTARQQEKEIRVGSSRDTWCMMCNKQYNTKTGGMCYHHDNRPSALKNGRYLCCGRVSGSAGCTPIPHHDDFKRDRILEHFCAVTY